MTLFLKSREDYMKKLMIRADDLDIAKELITVFMNRLKMEL